MPLGQLPAHSQLIDWPVDFVAQRKKPLSLINSCADDEKTIPIAPLTADIPDQLTLLTRSLEKEDGAAPTEKCPEGGRVPSTLSYSAIAALSGAITVKPSET
tara:strand:- start:26 stop:331 length:306 start_codon:yes stop_codon:yes gene_type:complete